MAEKKSLGFSSFEVGGESGEIDSEGADISHFICMIWVILQRRCQIYWKSWSTQILNSWQSEESNMGPCGCKAKVLPTGTDHNATSVMTDIINIGNI